MTDPKLEPWPPLVGDLVFGDRDSPVAVCTLASRSLLQKLAGRAEIAVAGRVFTENIGVERMVKNLVANSRLRALIVCGRESPHRTGQTIVSLHRNGLDASRRVIGSDGPDPILPNLTEDELERFRSSVALVEMIGEVDPAAIVARALMIREELGVAPPAAPFHAAQPPEADIISADRSDPNAWTYDPAGFFLIFARREQRLIRVEHYGQDRTLRHVFEGESSQDLCHTILRRGIVTEISHAAYLGRELERASIALRLGLHYEQDSPLNPSRTAC